MLPGNRYIAQIVAIRSLDDMTAMVDLGISGFHRKTRLRLFKVGTPPPDSGVTVPPSLMEELRARLIDKTCTITVHYGRGGNWIVTLEDQQGSVNEQLISLGYLISHAESTGVSND
jgi:hypothetical protein